MTRSHRGGLTHDLFKVGVIIKAIDGVLEVVGGIVLIFVEPEKTLRLIRALTQNQLSGNAHNVVVEHLTRALHHFSGSTRAFAVLYLAGHGVIKLVLVAGLLMKRRWAYLAGAVAFFLFLVYQVYRYTRTHSVGLLGLSVADAFIIVLTVLEYRRLSKERALR